ncbi:protein vreteno [Contarinia nasturtii]|uniref:protein vreteno n=1 Tax=Contarinia nasturtii TaxID=265458 RepID=UPI0012D499B0|nr:protein vreteno [Contarinia nasturtii]
MEFEEDQWELPEKFSYDERRKHDKVILKNIPPGFTDDGIISMCQQYGQVKHFNRPNGALFAFVQYESSAEVENILRRFNDDNESLPIIVEHAREKEPVRNQDDYDFLNAPALLNDDTPLRNVLELSKRKVQGPFADPTAISRESLIQGKDYRNIMLKVVDKSKCYHWDSNIEAHVDYESENGYKIVHGRAILKSSSLAPSKADNSLKKKPFIFKSDSIDYGIVQCENDSYASDKKCKQCNKNYCTLNCHAISCKKPDKLDETGPSKSPSIFDFTIKSEPIMKTVKLTAVINHRLVFVRPAEDDQETAFAQLLNDTVKCAINAETYKSLPSIASLVLAKYDYYQRALVLKHINDTEVAVAFIDFGNIETRPYSELKVMPSDLQKRKPFATKIHLSKINEDLMNEQALRCLYNLMMHDIELKIKKEMVDENPLYELKAPDNWVNQMVNDWNTDGIDIPKIKDISCRIFSTDASERFERPIKLAEMSGKEVIIMDNSQIIVNYISFLAVDDLNEFLQNERRIQNISNYLFTVEKSYTPRTDEYCVVRYKGRWYRAECVEICYDGFATMRFIDYGMMQLIEINDIRGIPDALVFKSITMTDIDCFPDHGVMSFEETSELKKVYQVESHHRIQRMEKRTEIDKNGENSDTIYAWLESCPQ